MSDPKSGPARMATRQSRFLEALTLRFNDVIRALKDTVGQNNALGITNADPVDNFPFETPEENLPAFVDWWNNAVREDVLVPTPEDSVTVGRHWTAQHIDAAYEDGIRWGNGELRDSGAVPEGPDVEASVRLPAHREALRTVRTRAYSNLEGITTDMEERIADLLADEVAEGSGPPEVARKIASEVETINSTRGRVLARTEIMNAHSNATGTQYQRFGVEYANIITSNPCPICSALEDDNPYPTNEAAGLLPAHPNCVCALAPAEAPGGS